MAEESKHLSKTLEAGHEVKSSSLDDPENGAVDEIGEVDAMAIPSFMVKNRWQRLANKWERSSGAEARGIERVDDSLRTGFNTASDYFHMTTIWFSVNLTVIANYLSAL